MAGWNLFGEALIIIIFILFLLVAFVITTPIGAAIIAYIGYRVWKKATS